MGSEHHKKIEKCPKTLYTIVIIINASINIATMGSEPDTDSLWC
ncbi:MAG TPA: hypothetical protein PLV62_07905 [Spirochaetota bacterium]|nr:hypothetical protein [Spirochaetota bacterium]